MADESVTYKVVLEGDAAGGSGVKQVVEDIGASAAKSTESLQAVKDLSAAANQAGESLAKVGDISGPTDKSNLSLRGMRETLSAVDQAAHGSAIGLGKAIEGIVKMSGASDDAQKNIASLTSKLGAIGVGFGIGSSIGDAIYKNIVTPIWDAIDAHQALNDPAREAYESVNKVRDALIEANSAKLADVKKEAEALKETLKATAEEADLVKKSLDEVNKAKFALEQSRIANQEARGQITPVEAKQQTVDLQKVADLNALLEKEAEAIKNYEAAKGTFGESSDVTQSLKQVVDSFNMQFETLFQSYQTKGIELGAESKKLLEQIEQAIKAKEADIAIDKGNLAVAQKSLNPAAQGEELANLQQDEALLTQLKEQAARIRATMGESIKMVTDSFQEGTLAYSTAMSEATGVWRLSLDEQTEQVTAAADTIGKDVEGAGKVFTEKVTGATGSMTSAIDTMGKTVVGGLESAIRSIETLASSIESMKARMASTEALAASAAADSSLALSQVKNAR